MDIPKNQDGKAPADEEQTIDNRSLLGALSWLSSQSRPDLACGVAMSQQLQRSPATEDVRFVNKLAGKAREHREHGVYLRRVPLSDAVFLAYHDAGWANADLEESESRLPADPSGDRERGRSASSTTRSDPGARNGLDQRWPHRLAT